MAKRPVKMNTSYPKDNILRYMINCEGCLHLGYQSGLLEDGRGKIPRCLKAAALSESYQRGAKKKHPTTKLDEACSTWLDKGTRESVKTIKIPIAVSKYVKEIKNGS